jgi:hypothetical protein
MGEDRKKPSVAFWVTALLVAVLTGYLLSFGPACWIASRTRIDENAIFRAVYWPLGWLIHHEVPAISGLLAFYATAGISSGEYCRVPGEGDEFSSLMIGPAP